MSDAFAAVLSELQEGAGQGWTGAIRERGRAAFRALGLPNQRHEDWKYTSVRPIERRSFKLAPAGAADEAPGPLPALDSLPALGYGERAPLGLVFVDGQLAARSGTAPQGVTVLSLAEAVAGGHPAVRTCIEANGVGQSNGFTALNTAQLADGAAILIEEGVQVEHPIHLLFAASGADDRAVQPRNVFWLGAGANAHITEHYTALADGTYFTNNVTNVVLADGAALEHTRLQTESRKAFHVASIEVRQSEGTQYTNHALSVGAALARYDINTEFAAPNGSCALNGLYLGSARQHVDFHIRTFHNHPHCTSRQYYKGVLDGSARGVFNGQVHVLPSAQKSDAQQANHNLLLSRNTEIDTKPQLEIYADDVRCAHGTTVGQLDEQMLFYLRSRGIPEPQARGLLTYGFAHDVVERIPIEGLRQHIEHVLIEILPYGKELKELV